MRGGHADGGIGGDRHRHRGQRLAGQGDRVGPGAATSRKVDASPIVHNDRGLVGLGDGDRDRVHGRAGVEGIGAGGSLLDEDGVRRGLGHLVVRGADGHGLWRVGGREDETRRADGKLRVGAEVDGDRGGRRREQ